jgi:hypothetical protein
MSELDKHNIEKLTKTLKDAGVVSQEKEANLDEIPRGLGKEVEQALQEERIKNDAEERMKSHRVSRNSSISR